MTEDHDKIGEEKLLILPLGEESRKITQVISNDTARQIIELLADAPLSASDISERLKAPLTTIAYNLDNLERVGLIRIEKIRYSEKGREVKIYAPVRKLIVVVPEKTDQKSVADLLRRYLGIILASVLASGLIEFLGRNKARKAEPSVIAAESSTMIVNETMNDREMVTAINDTAANVPFQKSVAENISIVEPSTSPDLFTQIAELMNAHPGLIFLTGCLFAVALIMIFDRMRKNKK